MSFTFNGIKKDYLRVLAGVERPVWAPIEEEILEISGRAGGVITSKKIKIRRLNIPVRVYKKVFESLEDVEEDLAAWLITDEPKPLVFLHKPNRTYYAKVTGELMLDEYPQWGEGVISFICPDPYKYGPERQAIFPSDVVTLTNQGTAEADPIFELEVKEPATFAMIQNHNNEYMMIGKPYDITEQEPFVREEKIFDRIGNTTTGWAAASTVDGGVVAGTFYTDGQAWRAQTYGPVTNAWRGPSLQQSLPELLDDFKVEVFMTVKPKTLKSFGRAELYLLNQGGGKIGKLAMKNIGTDGGSNVGEANIRHESTGESEFLIRTPGVRQRLWNDFYGVLRLERENGVYRAYIGMIDTSTGKHHTRWSAEFKDGQGVYTDPLAAVQIHLGQYSSHQFIEDIAIHRIIVYKLNHPDDNQVPYIAYPGDIITFDGTTKDMLINGEDRMDLKDFGASFFKLAKGENQLVVMPENSFDVRVNYRDKFK